MTGVIKNRHGTYYAQRKVPKGLEEATAQVLGVAKDRQVFLKRSLGTKNLREANIRAKPVQQEFDRTLERARALLKERPKRDTLSAIEIKRLADYHFAANPAPAMRDVSVGEALAYVCFREWGREFMDAAGATGTDAAGAMNEFLQAAADGGLQIWGKLNASGVFEPIPPEYWRKNQIEWFGLLKNAPTTQPSVTGVRDARYVELMTSRSQVEKAWARKTGVRLRVPWEKRHS
jgi:hypothetical protein